MAEYLCSSTSSTRRTTIIREAKFPKTSQVAQYDGSREALVNFLSDGTRNFRHFADAVGHLERRESRPGASDWLRRDSRNSIEAIAAFQSSYNKTGLNKLDCTRPSQRLPALEMWATRVTVSVDLIARRNVKEGPDEIGGIVFLFSRGEKSTATRLERSKTIAGLIYTFAREHLSSIGEPSPSLCLAVDVFPGVAHKPPGTFVRKLRNIEDACNEISDRWARVLPPDDYDGPDPS
jgi:hypothetical protein